MIDTDNIVTALIVVGLVTVTVVASDPVGLYVAQNTSITPYQGKISVFVAGIIVTSIVINHRYLDLGIENDE